MSDEAVRRTNRKVSLEQLKLLIDFMSQHPKLAAGTYRSLEARHQSKLLWGEAAKLLNGYKGGIRRPSNGWSKYWSDFKIKLKKRLMELKKKQMGVIKKEVSPITKLEKRALHILGPRFGKKYIKHTIEDSASDPLPPEIKQESITISNGFIEVNSENDRLSDPESEHSLQLSDDEVDEEEQTLDDPVNDIYPQWLIEVEKKRAEADLRRAKAEELRAEVAVKNSEAALAQSQALRKLADAADRQAGAIQRIAMLMESRQPRDGLLNL